MWQPEATEKLEADGVRALSVGEVKFSGMVLPTMRKLEYIVELKRVIRRKFTLGTGDGWLNRVLQARARRPPVARAVVERGGGAGPRARAAGHGRAVALDRSRAERRVSTGRRPSDAPP